MAFPGSRCTGVALDAQTALTAAHCAYGQERITAALSGYGEPPYWDATHWEIHPDYLTYLYSGNQDREKSKSDIAVVQFDKARTGEDGLPPPYVDGFFDPLDPADASQCLRFCGAGMGQVGRQRVVAARVRVRDRRGGGPASGDEPRTRRLPNLLR